MNTFIRFFYEFISIFVDGFMMVIKGIFEGICKMFNFGEYAKLISNYQGNFSAGEKILVTLSVIVLVVIILLLVFLLIMFIRKLLRKADKNLDKDELLSEISDLNDQVTKLMKERDEIMAMKVSQLGINPEDGETEEGEGKTGEEGEEELDLDTAIRFPKLVAIDNELGETKPKNYDNNFTLEELIENFRCFAASQLKLYYDYDILRPFFGGLACGKLIILQGISGTGKTSLAYAWGKFVEQDSCVSSVEPSWKDKSEDRKSVV